MKRKDLGLVGLIAAVNIVMLVRNRINFIRIQIGFLSVFLSWNDVQSCNLKIFRGLFSIKKADEIQSISITEFSDYYRLCQFKKGWEKTMSVLQTRSKGRDESAL